MSLFNVKVDTTHFRLPDKLAAFGQKLDQKTGKAMAKAMRFDRRGGVVAQFDQEAAISFRGRRAWKKSQRVKKFGGKTLRDTGAYRRQWLGRGSASLTRITKSGARGPSVTIGVRPVGSMARVRIFQKDRPTRLRSGAFAGAVIAQRPIRFNSPMVTAARVPYVKALKKRIKELGG